MLAGLPWHSGVQYLADKILDPWRSQTLLSDAVPFPPTYVTRDVDLALRFARKHYPVVLKAVRDDLVHKTDAGAVVLNVQNDDQLIHHFYSLQTRLDSSIIVQKQLKGVELFVGGKKDPQFGPTILFGLGGIFVEVYGDVVARVAPLSREDAEEMVGDIKGAPILKGARGTRVDMDAVINILLRFSEFLVEHPEIAEVDINPVIANAGGAYAVDARVVLSR